ncbi:MAG: type 4a pilus biogenesis protein PilO [Desulfobacterales bacterium]|nr:type 4a pilus biogenesis protein PilO [Desulfobacterales bacterium]
MAESKQSGLESFFKKIEKLTKVHKILICVIPSILLIGASVYFLYMPKHEEIKKLKQQLQTLEAKLRDVKKKAKRLPQLKKEIAEKQKEFNEAKKSLPESQEIPTLLTSISHSGQDAGLEFLLFQPSNERKVDFYAEIPVSINVMGNYHNVLLFFDKVAKLHRIVNIKNITMKPAPVKKNPDRLNVTCTAVTYTFLE